MPVVPYDAPAIVPNGEVAPSGGMTVPTWANAGLQHNKGHAAAAIKQGLMDNNGLMEDFSDKSERVTRRAAASTSNGAEAMTFFFITADTG